MPFFTRLNYSFGNEDWATELKALKIKPGSQVLCVTASGDRPLHLMLDNPAKITAIDANFIQNRLLELKYAALQTLEYDDYIRFLGVVPSNAREQQFQKVTKKLTPTSASFWNKHGNMVRNGILYQGHIERVTRYVAAASTLFRPHKTKKLFEHYDLTKQSKFIQEEWDTLALRKIFDIVLSRFISKTLTIDPGLYVSIPNELRLGHYIYDRMLDILHRYLAKENPLVSLLFRGYVGWEALPAYLKPNGVEKIKNSNTQLSILTEDMIKHMENVLPGTYDTFSLSDVASYISQEKFNRMITGMYHAATPGARFCIRQFSSNHQIPAGLSDRLVRDVALERQLEKEEKCFIYRFMVGKILK